jgi:hypothetical protein
MRSIPVDHDQQQDDEYGYCRPNLPDSKSWSLGVLHLTILAPNADAVVQAPPRVGSALHDHAQNRAKASLDWSV